MTFFDKYTYKQKNYVLLIVLVLLAAVVYKRSISVTLQTKAYERELNEKLILAESALMEIRTKKLEIEQLDKLLGRENLSVEKVQQGFLNFFAKHSEKLSVYQIEEVIKFQHPDFSINTHQAIIKGSYTDVLKFIYKLEKDFELARLVNISFEYKKTNSEEPESLYTKLILQNYMR